MQLDLAIPLLIMIKPFNNDAIFFLGLSVGMGIFHCLLYFTVGADLLTQDSFANFFLLANVISSFASAFILRSYYDQHFKIAFVTGLIAFFTTLLRVVLVYCILVPLTKAFQRYYPLILIFDLAATLLAAGSLVLSRAGKNGWLKTAGVSSFLIACITLTLLIWSMQVHGGRSTPSLERWQLCLSFVASLQPLLFIGYFRQLPAVQSKSSDSSQSSQQTTLLITARLLGVTMFLFLGISLMGEGMRAIRPQPEAIAQAQFFKARTFKGQHGDTLSYRLLMPEGYDPDQRYPLVVSLHGGAGYGTDNVRQLASWEIQQLTEPKSRKKYPAFILAPQIFHGTSWGGLPHLVTRDTIVFDLLRALKAEFSIDPNRVYVVGHSLGGYGTWHFIGTRPGVFAAAIPLSGAGDPSLAKNMVDVSVWAFHGETDRNVLVDGSRKVIKAMQQAGGHPRYTEFADVGHYLNPSLNTTPGILDWLFAQKRVSPP
ncbi:carboxylesterase family protein [Dyadobacter diqingensis]|uniref:carboxylesterase family protein n=1 Tax=Dyadobacter diqingensis TaxID=2938121 RepID=UPI0020C324B1|nr:prolyl oligopeptidase family serine peptidase [Dyadobacter diqingensis]